MKVTRNYRTSTDVEAVMELLLRLLPVKPLDLPHLMEKVDVLISFRLLSGVVSLAAEIRVLFHLLCFP